MHRETMCECMGLDECSILKTLIRLEVKPHFSTLSISQNWSRCLVSNWRWHEVMQAEMFTVKLIRAMNGHHYPSYCTHSRRERSWIVTLWGGGLSTKKSLYWACSRFVFSCIKKWGNQYLGGTILSNQPTPHTQHTLSQSSRSPCHCKEKQTVMHVKDASRWLTDSCHPSSVGCFIVNPLSSPAITISHPSKSAFRKMVLVLM